MIPFLSFPPCQKQDEIFIFTVGHLVELLEVNVVGFFLRLGYPAVLTLRDNLTEHPAICQIQFPFSSWALDATAVFTHESLLQ